MPGISAAQKQHLSWRTSLLFSRIFRTSCENIRNISRTINKPSFTRPRWGLRPRQRPRPAQQRAAPAMRKQSAAGTTPDPHHAIAIINVSFKLEMR